MKRLLIAALLASASVSVFAAEPRKVDFTTVVVIDGKPMVDDFKCPEKAGKRDCETPFTVGELAYLSLERPVQNQSWTDAIKHDDLARAVRNAKDFTLLEDQKISIEAAMGPLWAPSVLGFVKSVIDPSETSKAP